MVDVSSRGGGGTVAGMRVALEREVKLRPGVDFAGLRLEGRDLEPRILWSTYYDTDGLRLAAGSVTLRRRAVEKEAVWQLKLGRGRDRKELEWPADSSDVPHEVAALLVAHTRGERLRPIATLRTERRGVIAQTHGCDVAEVVEDHVDVLDDERVVSSFEELEIESVDGDAKMLRRLEKRLRRAGAVDPDGRPKLFQALDLTLEPGPRDGNSRPQSARECLAFDLRQQFHEILAHDPGMRVGDDPESLHRQRVAVRRMRAMLRAARPLLDRVWADDLREALKPAGRYLGEVRDLDVQIARFERQATKLEGIERQSADDLVDNLRRSRSQAHAELIGRLSEPWYISLLNRLELAVEEPRFAGHGSLRKRVKREHRRARRIVKKLPHNPTDTQLHEVRKAAKRARYAAEVAASCNTSGLKRYLKRAKRLQDTLGDHQDAVVALELLHDINPIPGLVDQNIADKATSRAAFPQAWKHLDNQRPR